MLNKFIKWITGETNNTIDYSVYVDIEEVVNKNQLPLEVVIKDRDININNLQEYDKPIKKFEFRPETFDQFIGQEEAKKRAKTIIKAVNKGIFTHLLIDGIKGHGKTTFALLLAKQIGAKIIERIGRQINENNIIDILNEINVEKGNVVLFVDEIDTMDWRILKLFNTILESFELEGKRIKPFLFVGATINKHLLIKNNPDLLDRISFHIKFKKYTDKEIELIIKQYKNQLYSDEKISKNIFSIIAKNCKYNPRTAISMLKEVIIERDINEVLRNRNIIINGLTDIDIKILKILNGRKRPIGANALAIKCGLSEKEYLLEYEPFLVEYGYIDRIPSRIITNKGLDLLSRLS